MSNPTSCSFCGHSDNPGDFCNECGWRLAAKLPRCEIHGYKHLFRGEQNCKLRVFDLEVDERCEVRIEVRTDYKHLGLTQKTTQAQRVLASDSPYYMAQCRFNTSERSGCFEIEVDIAVVLNGMVRHFRAAEGAAIDVPDPNWRPADFSAFRDPIGKVKWVREKYGIGDVRLPGNVDVEVYDKNFQAGNFVVGPHNKELDFFKHVIRLALVGGGCETMGITPHPAIAGSITASASGTVSHLRLFALDTVLLGRMQSTDLEADILLEPWSNGGPDPQKAGFISGRHALIHHERGHFLLEDVSRWGTCIDTPENYCHRGRRHWLSTGTQIFFTATARDVAALRVVAATHHAIYLERSDHAAGHEVLVIMSPNTRPEALPDDATAPYPLVFHDRGGFWFVNPENRMEIPLAPGTEVPLGSATGRFGDTPYPDRQLQSYVPGYALREALNTTP